MCRFSSLARRAAPMKDRNSGCGFCGRDLNSGWNWHATNHGCSGSSTISTRLSSGAVPAKTNPFAASFAHTPSREGPQEKSNPNEVQSDQAASKTAQGAQFLKDAQQSWMSMQEKAVAMWQEASNQEHSAPNQSSTHDAKGAEHPTSNESAAHQASTDQGHQEAKPEGVDESPRGSASGLAPDPMQWWGALTEQFSEIATKTLAEIQKHSASLPKKADAPLSPQSAEKAKPALKPQANTKVNASGKVNAKANGKASGKPKGKDTERAPSVVSAPSKAKAPAKKVAPKSRAKPPAKSSARQLAAKGPTPSKAKVAKSALSSVLAKTIADSDANPIQNNARKHAR